MGTYTIKSSIDDYLEETSSQYSTNTLRAYHDGLENFCRYLLEIGIVAERAPTITLSEELIISFFKSMTTLSVSTVNLYFFAVTNWLAFLHERDPDQAYFPEINKKIQAIIPKPSRRKHQMDLKGKLVRYMVGQEEKTAIFSQRTRLALEDYHPIVMECNCFSTPKNCLKVPCFI